jgi:integrase
MGIIRKIVSPKTDKVSWQIDYLDPDKIRIRKTFNKKKEAEAELGKRVSLIAENRYLDVKKEYTTTLAELIAKYEENFKHQPSWFDKQRYLNNFKDKFGKNALLSYIRYVDLETYKTELTNKPVYKMVAKTTQKGRRVVRETRQRKESTINREMSCIRHMFKKAVEWEMVEQSPFDRGQSLLLKENNQRLRFLTEDEIKRLLDNCPPYLKDIVECDINSGMRRGEILSLEWEQIRNGLIYLRSISPRPKLKIRDKFP